VAEGGVVNRRAFLAGLGSLGAALPIAPYPTLMPVHEIVVPVDKFAVPAGFNEYEAAMWRKLMQLAWVLERLGRPFRDKITEALRTRTLPENLRWHRSPRSFISPAVAPVGSPSSACRRRGWRGQAGHARP
jgi:hypothetical protein